jgi:hypothetical protein
MDVVGDDLGMGPRPSEEMAASPEEPLVKRRDVVVKRIVVHRSSLIKSLSL